jgi:TctA family transporter
MAILMGAFFLLGLVPGPDMLTKHLTLTYSMVWTIAISNVIIVLVCLLFINRLAKLTTVRGNLMIPVVLLLCFIGAYTSNNSIADLIVLMVFGAVGYFMVKYRFPRPPFILGFILGKLAETYLYSSATRYGAAWLLRPKVLIILAIAVAFAVYPFVQKRFKKEDLSEPDKI